MLTQVVQSNDTLRELTFCVIEDENLRKRRDASRSDPPKIVVCKPSQRPESPLSILKKTDNYEESYEKLLIRCHHSAN